MTQTEALAPLPPAVDLRTVRSDRCHGEGGWMVGGEDPWWTACDGCATCAPEIYRAVSPAPSATAALARAMAAMAAADQPF